MRMHSIIPWPSALFDPARKSEPKRKAKAADQSLALLESAVQRTPPPKQEFDDGEEPRGENLTIIV